MIQHLSYRQYAEMRWKNGQGVTHEVCRFPDAQPYDWRVSIATIGSDGPFSHFPGYLRNISVLEGEGMQLTIDGQPHAFITPFQATDFNGDSDVFCAITGGPLLDFNVIWHADSVRAAVRWATGGEWAHHQGTLLLFNAGDTLDVMVDASCYRLQHYDSLRIDAPARVAVRHSADNRLACVTLTRVKTTD